MQRASCCTAARSLLLLLHTKIADESFPLALLPMLYDAFMTLAMSSAATDIASNYQILHLASTSPEVQCCFRSAIAVAMTSWWANEYILGASDTTAVANFAAVDAYPFTAVQPTDVSIMNATFNANISNGTPDAFTYVSQVCIGVQANTSAFSTNVTTPQRPRRHLAEFNRDTKALSTLPEGGGARAQPRRQLVQSNAFQALQIKLQGLISSFHGASPCNATEISLAYYQGQMPILNGDRPFKCINYSVDSADNIDTYLTSNSASWLSLPLFHILSVSQGPTVVQQSPPVAVDSILAAEIQSEVQLYASSQAQWQQQLTCVKSAIASRRHLHELTALVEASLAMEGQITEAELVLGLYQQQFSRLDDDTEVQHYNEADLYLGVRQPDDGSPVSAAMLAPHKKQK